VAGRTSDSFGPPPGTRFRRRLGPVAAVRQLWGARELTRALASREFRARYKQTLLGMSWAVVTPLLLMMVFVLFVEDLANVDAGDAPYAVFTYVGLLPWAFFSTSVSRGGTVLILESSVLNKVKCPREVFPIANVAVAGLDFAVGLVVLVGLFLITGFAPQPELYWAPFIFGVQVVATIGIVLVTSITVVYIRDLAQALPLLLQVGLFATPVAYSIESLPEGSRTLYAAINPLVGVIASYRLTILQGDPPDWSLLGPSALSAIAWFVLGYALFKRLETGIADVS